MIEEKTKERKKKKKKKTKNALVRLGLKCNQKCVFCTRANSSKKNLSTEEVKEKIKELTEQGIKDFDFTGGEPTVREDIVEIIEFTKKQKANRIALQTNGVEFSDGNFLRDLMEAGLNYLTFSFHSHRQNKYNRITDSDNYERAVQALENISRENLSYCISHVVNDLNYEDLTDFVDFIENYNPELIYFGFIRPNGRTKKNKWIVPRLREAEEDIKRVMEYCQDKSFPFLFDALPLCYMEEFVAHSSDYQRNKNKEKEVAVDPDRTDEDFDNMNSSVKVKGEQCKRCSLNHICPGLWQEYAEIYGTGELKPIEK